MAKPAPLRVDLLKPAGTGRRGRALSTLDGRTAVARFLRDTTAELLKGIAEPTAAQRILARTTAAKIARLDALEAELAASGENPFDDHRWLQWLGSLERSLDALGLTPPRDGKGFRAPGKQGDGARPAAAQRDGGTLATYAAQRGGVAA